MLITDPLPTLSMKETAAAIQPGTAALFVLVRKVTADKVLDRLKGEGGTVKAKSPPPAAPKAAEIRTETITYDTWTVSCRDTLDGKTRKICSAQLPMVAMQQNQQVQLGAWMIGRNSEGALLSIVQTPQVNVGVLISKGIEIKLGLQSSALRGNPDDERSRDQGNVVCGQ